MADVMELLDDVYREAAIGDVVAQHVVARALRDGDEIVKRRRQRGWTAVAAAIVVVGAGIALVVGGPSDRPATVTVSQSTVHRIRPGLPQATAAEFPGAGGGRAWARSVDQPNGSRSVGRHRDHRAHDGRGVRRSARLPTSALTDKPIYAVQLTGTTFTCDHSCFYVIRPPSGPAATSAGTPALGAGAASGSAARSTSRSSARCTCCSGRPEVIRAAPATCRSRWRRTARWTRPRAGRWERYGAQDRRYHHARPRSEPRSRGVGRRRGRRAVVDDRLGRPAHGGVGQGGRQGDARVAEAQHRRRHILHDRVHRARRSGHGRLRHEGARSHQRDRSRRLSPVHAAPPRLPVRHARRHARDRVPAEAVGWILRRRGVHPAAGVGYRHRLGGARRRDRGVRPRTGRDHEGAPWPRRAVRRVRSRSRSSA